MTPGGLEPPTFRLGNERSVRMSYGAALLGAPDSIESVFAADALFCAVSAPLHIARPQLAPQQEDHDPAAQQEQELECFDGHGGGLQVRGLWGGVVARRVSAERAREYSRAALAVQVRQARLCLAAWLRL